jgi:osmoprotectant transport system ATP-binding protein
MIELKNVSRRYGDVEAVRGLSFSVREGEVCVVVGPSGCGKSTALKMINRMLEPTSGEVRVFGRDVREYRPEVLRRRIGYVIQSVGLFPHMSVAENIAVVPKLLAWEKKRIDERVEELLQLIGLDPAVFGAKYPSQLSGGEAQRIGVARALAADPPILLMDEPFGAVDPLNREVLQAEFAAIHRRLGKTVVFVTHDLDEAIRLAGRIAIMEKGSLVQYDTPENVLAHPANRFVYSFVGSDRALKRLSRFPVSAVMRRPVAVGVSDDIAATVGALGKERKIRFLWVLDEGGRLRGWINVWKVSERVSIEEATTEATAGQIAVRQEASLKEVLARMLAEGIKVVPVVDRDDRVVGEISLADIERVTEEVDSQWQVEEREGRS